MKSESERDEKAGNKKKIEAKKRGTSWENVLWKNEKFDFGLELKSLWLRAKTENVQCKTSEVQIACVRFDNSERKKQQQEKKWIAHHQKQWIN